MITMNNMARHLQSFLALPAICGLVFLPGCKPHEEPEKLPNIILVVADDMGQDMSIYGDPNAYTPNLDQFAHEHVFFSNGYVTTASCSPSRSAMLTGLYPFQNGQLGLSHRGFEMNGHYDNLFSVLHSNGYATGLLGKLHVKPFADFPHDYAVSIDFPEPWVKEPGYNNDSIEVLTVSGVKRKEKVKFAQTVGRMADSADFFFRKFGDKPFFLMVNLLDPHHPFYDQIDGYPARPISPGDIRQMKYYDEDTPENRENLAGYYNGVARVDTAFAMITESLKKQGKYDNTLIIFIGDHGAPFKRSKLTCYEKGLRIPFLVKFPGDKYAGTYPEDVQTIDIFPTVLKLAGLTSSNDLPGISLTSIVKGEDRHDFIVGEFDGHTADYIFPVRSFKKDNYKLIVNYMADYYRKLDSMNIRTQMDDLIEKFASRPGLELYNLQEDPDEQHNLADDPACSNRLKSLQEQLHEFELAHHDTLVLDENLTWYKNRIKPFMENN